MVGIGTVFNFIRGELSILFSGAFAIIVMNPLTKRVAGQAHIFRDIDFLPVALAFFVILDHPLLESQQLGGVFLFQAQRFTPAAKLFRTHQHLPWYILASTGVEQCHIRRGASKG